MTVPAQANRVSYNGNGVDVLFNYNSSFISQADILVILYTLGVPSFPVLGVDYTVAGGDTGSGPHSGSVTFAVAPPGGTTVILIGNPTIQQLLTLLESGSQPALAFTNAWDLITLIAQRLSDRLDLALTLPDDYSNVLDPLLPEGGLPGQILQINPSGTGWIWVTPTLLAADVDDNTFVLLNNQAVAIPVTGMFVNSALNRGAIYEYDVMIGSSLGYKRAIGRLILTWNPATALWSIFNSYDGDNTGIAFTVITAGVGGQVNYTTPNTGGTTYVGKLNWKTRLFNA